jgi:hypothetical protein
VSIDEPTYRELMWTFAQKGKADETQELYDRMVAAGITPDDRHQKAVAWARGETARRLPEGADVAPPTPDEAPSTPDVAAPTPDVAPPPPDEASATAVPGESAPGTGAAAAEDAASPDVAAERDRDGGS